MGEDSPLIIPTPPAAHLVRFLPPLLVIILTAALTLTNFQLVSRPGISAYQDMQQRVLNNKARNFYQYDMYFLASVDEMVRERLPVSAEATLTTWFGCCYLAMLLAMVYWLRQLYHNPLAISIGLLTTGFYALVMLPLGYHHPSDMAALACFTVCLGLLTRRRWDWLLVICALAGLFSSKHLLIAVPIFIQELGRRHWLRAGLIAAVAGAVSLLIPGIYRLWILGPHGVAPAGILGPWEWLKMLPYGILVQAILCAAPVLSLAVFSRKLSITLLGALAAYWLLLLICAMQSNIIHEARTFWLGVPAFAAALALWGEHGGELPTFDACTNE